MKKLILLGIISFLLATLWLTPLAFVTPHLSKVVKGIELTDPSGTIWNGKANNLRVQNIDLGKVSWKVAPIKSLTSLSFKSKFRVDGDEIKANGLMGVNLKKNLVIDNTQFDINSEFFNQLQTNAVLSGSFNGFINTATLKQNKDLPSIDGIVNWQDASLTKPIMLDKGNYRAILKPSGKNIDIKLSSKEAPIELNGNIMLQSDWKFDTNLITKSSNIGLMAMMKFAGKPQKDGSIAIKQKGDLKPFIGLN